MGTTTGEMPSAADAQFLQTMLCEHSMTERRAKELFTKCRQADPATRGNLDAAIARMNGSASSGLGRLQLELTWTKAEDAPCIRHLVLANTADDDIATKFGFGVHGNKADEQKLELLKHLITAIAAKDGVLDMDNTAMMGRSPNNIHGGQPWNPEVSTMNPTEVKEAIGEFLLQGWLVERDEGLGIGVRALVELSGFVEKVDGVDECVCSDTVTYGVSCEECKKKLHFSCARTMFQSRTTCPSCDTAWDLEDNLGPLVPEEALPDEDEGQVEEPAQNSRSKRARRSR